MNVLESFRLHGKVAVVTGATSGLGAAIATALGEAGADVALGGRRTDRLVDLQRALERLGRRAISVTTDVTQVEECTAFAEAAFSHFGRIDVLVNCAGVASATPALRETPTEFRDVLETNLMGTYWMAQACAKRMEPGSSIINVGSVLGSTSMGLPQAAYTSSKAAIAGLTLDLSQQWSGRKGIRVNNLVPGFFPTEMTAKMNDEVINHVVSTRVPMGRLGELRECAAAAVFLASDAASYVTGISLPVDGGLLTM